MPASAIANVAVDHCLPLQAIAGTLVQLAGRTPGPRKTISVPRRLLREQAVFEGREAVENLNALGQPSGLTCPDCGGGLWELSETKPLRYRCHTGHAFTALSLDNAQVELTDHALWSAVRALQERELLLRRIAAVAEATGNVSEAEAGQRQADQLQAQAEQLAQLLQGEFNSA
jgi:two-component system chemotaxis response regulator CheB